MLKQLGRVTERRARARRNGRTCAAWPTIQLASTAMANVASQSVAFDAAEVVDCFSAILDAMAMRLLALLPELLPNTVFNAKSPKVHTHLGR